VVEVAEPVEVEVVVELPVETVVALAGAGETEVEVEEHFPALQFFALALSAVH